MQMNRTFKLCLALLLGLAPALSAADAAKEDARLLLLKPAVELPDDYDAVIAKAARAKASLVVLPLRNTSTGDEGAFEFAELATKSGLFAKVSVGDGLGNADYAVTGNWSAWTLPHGETGQGLARWMQSFCSAKLDLLFEGESLTTLSVDSAAAEVYLNPPISTLQLATAARMGLHQFYRSALYRLAKDINKRSGR